MRGRVLKEEYRGVSSEFVSLSALLDEERLNSLICVVALLRTLGTPKSPELSMTSGFSGRALNCRGCDSWLSFGLSFVGAMLLSNSKFSLQHTGNFHREDKVQVEVK